MKSSFRGLILVRTKFGPKNIWNYFFQPIMVNYKTIQIYYLNKLYDSLKKTYE